MTRTPAQRRKKKTPWDRAIQAPRLTFGETEEQTCADCGHRGQVHAGWFVGDPKKCCYFDAGGRNKCQCKKYVRPA
jgi:hypothetical protein